MVVTYHKWKSVDVPRQTKKRSDNPMTDTVKRQVRQSNTTTLGNLVRSYLDAVVALSMHIFIASWQWGQYRQTKQTMRPGTLVTVRDFAMNYLNIFQDKPSEAHWDHEQTTIFPVMNWYRCAKANCPHVVMHKQIFKNTTMLLLQCSLMNLFVI